MALIVKQIDNKRPVKQVKTSGDPRQKSREHMPNWEHWKNTTIEQLKNSKAAAAKDEQKGGK